MANKFLNREWNISETFIDGNEDSFIELTYAHYPLLEDDDLKENDHDSEGRIDWGADDFVIVLKAEVIMTASTIIYQDEKIRAKDKKITELEEFVWKLEKELAALNTK